MGTGKKPRAFTLIEMVVSLAIISIVFLAMGSVMVLSAHAIPDEAGDAQRAVDAADVMDQIVSELQTATSITSTLSIGVQFTVPDRDGDGVDEKIIYVWDQTNGGALLRQYNGGTVVKVLTGLNAFNLTFDTTDVSQPDVVEVSDLTTLSYNAGSSYLYDVYVTPSQWFAQYFEPALPEYTTSWSVDDIYLIMKRSWFEPVVTVALHLPDATGIRPDSETIDSDNTSLISLSSSYQWVKLSYDHADGLSPDTGLFITTTSSMSGSTILVYQSTGIADKTLSLSNGGPTWSWAAPGADQSLQFYVYGTYTTSTPQPPITVFRSVGITMNPGEADDTALRATAVLLNTPETP